MAPQPDIDRAVQFLQNVRPHGPWNLTAITPDVPGAESVVLSDAHKAATWLAKRAGRANCYWQPNPAPRPTGAAGRANKGDIAHTEFRHVDIDLDKLPFDHQWAPLDLDGRKARALKHLHAFERPGPPSIIVDTGGGLQALWRLAEPTPRSVEALDERQNEQLIALLGGDAGTFNVDRLLRLPFTVNHPDGKKRARGRVTAQAAVLDSNDQTYFDFEFDAAPRRAQEVESTVDVGPPEYIKDLAELGYVPERLLTIIEEGRLPEPKKDDDTRSAWVFDCVTGLIRAGVRDEIIAGILLDERWGISASIVELDEARAERAARRAIQNAHDRVGDDAAADDFPDDETTAAARRDAAVQVERFKPVRYTDLLALPLPTWLIDQWVTEGGLFTVFGAEKMYKSFIMLDVALCIATGRPWHGVSVKQGRVKYVIGEGNARRFADRITAWCIENKVSAEDVDLNFRVVPVRVGIDNKVELGAFFAADDSDYVLTIVDTVARNMDGDENSTKDMNSMVKGADRIREVHRTAVALVHHSGKDIAKGARGSTALPGAVDAIIHVTKNAAGQSVVTLHRARDSEQGQSLIFEPRSVIVSADEDPEVRTSLVMHFVRTGDDHDKRPAQQKAGKKTAVDKVLVRLAEAGNASSMSVLIDPAESGMSRANVQKAVRKLIEEGLVTPEPPYRCTAEGIEFAMEMGAVVPEDDEVDRTP
jgi:hypothetical protein